MAAYTNSSSESSLNETVPASGAANTAGVSGTHGIERIRPAGGAPPLGPYSPAVRAGGMLFTSGTIGNDAEGKLAEGGAGPQARQVMENLKRTLAAAGLGFGHVVKTGIFLTDMGTFAEVNAVYAAYFEEGQYPARETVAVSALPGGALVEISMVALAG